MKTCALALALVALGLPLALAQAPEAQVEDAEGDCAVAYGAGYLDLTRAWIESETEEGLVVALSLAAFDESLAEGAGYTVQFEHQGTRWGTLALFRPVSGAGWEFYTGRVDAGEADPSTFAAQEGSFDAAERAIRVHFPKALFPHEDPTDRELRAFTAATADLRTAYPFTLGSDRVAPGSSNGKWILCDEGEGRATYTFRLGAHSAEHEAHAASGPAQPAPADAAPDAGEPLPDEPPAASRETPLAGWLALAALGAACLARRR